MTLEGHAIAIQDGRILDLLPIAVARQKYQPRIETVLDRHVVIPGLINLHTHAAMTLLRGLGDDLPLQQWLENRIWPVEKALLSREFVLMGTKLACLEMLRGGTTTFSDMYFFADAAAEATLQVGMRASLGLTVIDFPTAWGSDAADYLSRGLRLRDQLIGEDRISFTLAPHSPYTVGDETFSEIAILSDQLDIPVHTHLHETLQEIADGIARYGRRPIARLEALGLIGPRLIAVHAVHVEPAEIELFARRGISVAHCPTSNLKLGSGIAPVADFLAAGVRVGIGTDGAASNNRLDMVGELRLAALLAKGASRRADALNAHQLLHCGTLAAAQALQLDAKIGSIVKGKQADIAAFDLGSLDMQPCFEPASHLFFVAGREHVTDVWVGGRCCCQKTTVRSEGGA